jgi:multiple sugar transport system substrate-binding protein
MSMSPGWKRTLALIAVVGLAIGACGPSATSSPSSAAGPSASAAGPGASTGTGPSAVANACGDAPITLNVWGGYPEMDAVYKKAGEAYTALHSNVSFTIFSTDLRGFEQKLTTALPSNTAGDVVIRTANFLSRFIDQSLLAPVPDDLSSFVKGGAYSDTVIQDSSYKDKVVGVPIFSSGTALYYNKDYLSEAGLSDPPTTMDQIWDYSKKLAKVDASGNVTRSGISLRLSGQGSGVAEKFWILLLQSGHELVKQTSPGHYAADYNGPDGVALFQHYVDALQNKIDSPNIDHDAKAFETKVTAMFAREPWVVAEIATTAPDLVGHYGSISLPTGDLGGTETMYVPTSAPNAACSWDFIRFLTAPEQQLTIPPIAGWLPSRKDLDLTAFLAANPGYEGFLKKPDGMKVSLTPPISEFDELETKLATHLVDAYADYANLSGHPDKIQALLNTWAEETNQILTAAGHGS